MALIPWLSERRQRNKNSPAAAAALDFVLLVSADLSYGGACKRAPGTVLKERYRKARPKMKSFSDSYKEAGVDITAGYKAVELMKSTSPKQ
jgi:hypothetical protein